MTIMSDLIEGLPNAIALMCLARVPYYLYPKLKLVSLSWNAAIRSVELFRIRQEVSSCEDLLCVCTYEPDNTWQLYDPLQDLWITLPKLPSEKRHLICFGAVFASQKLFVLGGRSDAVDPSTGDRDENFPTNEVWSYDFVSQKWSMRAPMLVPRAMFACCVLDGKIFVSGGFSSRSKSTSVTEMYDPEKDLWVSLPDLLQTHAACIGVVIGGKMHVIHHGVSTVHVFDHLELTWSSENYGTWLPGPMAVVRDSLYIMSEGLIFKQNKQVKQPFILVPQFRRRFGMAMIGFREKIYVIGGVIRAEPSYVDFVKQSDVHVLTFEGEKPTWSSVAPMTRCRGTILGCARLRI